MAGRRKDDLGERRTERITIRLTPTELFLIEKEARRVGLDRSALMCNYTIKQMKGAEAERVNAAPYAGDSAPPALKNIKMDVEPKVEGAGIAAMKTGDPNHPRKIEAKKRTVLTEPEPVTQIDNPDNTEYSIMLPEMVVIKDDEPEELRIPSLDDEQYLG